MAWAATFILHSTLLIGSIWLLTRLLGMKAMTVQDKLWKVALTGALFTCTVQAGLGDRAVGFRIPLPAGPLQALSAANRPVFPAELGSSRPAGGLTGLGDRSATLRPLPVRWPRLILLLWALGAAGFSSGLLLRLLRLRSLLQGRRCITSGHVYRIFTNLLASRSVKLKVRLTVSDRIPVPLACGIRRPEICLPRSLVLGVSPSQLKSVLAHELAHIVRRDQLWLLAARLAESIFFFQPLVRLARRCYQETAEFICDGEAVRQTGERVPLARSLHQLASRQVSAHMTLTTPGISGKGSPLNRRIEMILDKNRPAAGRARWFGPLAAALILAFALLAPGVTAFDDPPSPQEVEPAAAIPAPPAPSTPEEPEGAAEEEIEREMAEQETAMAEAEREMELEAEAMEAMEREMAVQEEAMAQAELEMAEQEAAMAEVERKMEMEAEAMEAMEREMAVQEEAMARAELEMELMERKLAEQEETLTREMEALEEEEAAAGADGGASREEARAREEEIRRRHREVGERHRQIVRQHAEISRHHRDVAREQAEALRQHRVVLRTEAVARRAERRGLERALRSIESSLDDGLTAEKRQRLIEAKLDIESKLGELEESDVVPRPTELE